MEDKKARNFINFVNNSPDVICRADGSEYLFRCCLTYCYLYEHWKYDRLNVIYISNSPGVGRLLEIYSCKIRKLLSAWERFGIHRVPGWGQEVD